MLLHVGGYIYLNLLICVAAIIGCSHIRITKVQRTWMHVSLECHACSKNCLSIANDINWQIIRNISLTTVLEELKNRARNS